MGGKNKDHELMRCVSCGKDKDIKRHFYVSNSRNYSSGRYPVCKLCLKKDLDTSNLEQVQDTLMEMNKPFISTLWESTCEEAAKTNKDVFGLYMKNTSSINFRGYTWKDSEFNNLQEDKSEIVSSNQIEENEEVDKQDVFVQEDEYEVIDIEDSNENQNKQDVLRMLGYDPFEGERKEDKRHLYNKLVDFLDESTLEDSFKLPAVIEIVKSFNQIDKINVAISRMVNDLDTSNAGGIKSLIDSKQKMLKAVLDLAKDNGISVNYNNNKSKGSGTLSGIIKQLQEKGFEESDVNLFDIETCGGIKQVADISNESIIKQLQMDENDYQGMLLEQREIIEELTEKVSNIEEENRKLKKELLASKDGEANE